MVRVTVLNKNFFINLQSGASMTEVILSLAIVSLATPFLYGQIKRVNDNIRDVSVANRIVATRDGVLNFVRSNQDLWPEVAQIKLNSNDLLEMSTGAIAGFIDKYKIHGASVTDVYLAFDFGVGQIQTNKIARHIGNNAAVVMNDGVAYAGDWAISVSDFKPGYLVYRISRDTSGVDTSQYLHRGASGALDLNVMQRDLNMGGHNIDNVGIVTAKSVQSKNVKATFAEFDELNVGTVHFASGANIEGGKVQFESVRVAGDISGFRNIYADKMNGDTYSTLGHVIADRANITESVNVLHDFTIKSDYVRTISGFSGIRANRVAVPFLRTEQLMFFENFGLTISGELINSGTSPLKIGSWLYPSTSLPNFNSITFTRANFSDMPDLNEFSVIMGNDWQSFKPKDLQ